jgi:hypothetical protein
MARIPDHHGRIVSGSAAALGRGKKGHTKIRNDRPSAMELLNNEENDGKAND